MFLGFLLSPSWRKVDLKVDDSLQELTCRISINFYRYNLEISPLDRRAAWWDGAQMSAV
jgi:hypothetical protein